MFGRFIPTEGKFFDLFNQHSECIAQGGRALADLIHAEPGAGQAHAQNVHAIEKRADRVTHDTIDLLHKTFITPFDRDQIHKLITTMDDILDLCEDVCETIELYDIDEMTAAARQLAYICVSCCDRVADAVKLLNDMHNVPVILKTCAIIDQLESDADRVMRSALSELFRSEADVKKLIKLKALYELLEEITDKCEDVANIIEGIALENS